MTDQTVTLNPGESKAVSFEVTPNEARQYTVAVDGLQGTFTATEPTPAEFEYTSGLTIKVTNEPTKGDIQWWLSVKNVSDVTGTLHLKIYQSGEDPGEPGDWSGYKLKVDLEQEMAAGEEREFTGTITRSAQIYNWRLKVVSEAGEFEVYG